ncbi:MAG TPA: MFS transporter [Gammaproteobacteria bacterium]|nr:MFS transporter [Gammaproteobacteria bacterium]
MSQPAAKAGSPLAAARPPVFSKARIVAGPGFNRWLLPPAAMAMHLSIGMAYGFSVFWLPLTRVLGVTAPVAGDWQRSEVMWTFTLFFIFLGSAAALFGHWLEKVGPRLAGTVAACCWGGGFLIAALGVYWHRIELLWLGAGVIGGCGLGLGYISPVSMLIKWFPDRRGVATGMAIMGFGGGAMIGAPLADWLMRVWATDTSVGVWETFATLGVLYFVVMMIGAFGYRLPPEGWRPSGWQPRQNVRRQVQGYFVHLDRAHHTPQFWLLWAVLCLNVSAGIAVLGVASPMLQEVFGGRLLGEPVAFADLTSAQAAAVASVAAGFTGLLSLFNIIGRFLWASASDWLGRKGTYTVFFLCGALLYALAPMAGELGQVAAFVTLFCVILTMYGGGFATIPAYLADLFGTQYVGAIHGRLLTAWSTAGILGPLLLSGTLEALTAAGASKASAYGTTMYLLAGLLVLGLLCNLAVRPVAERFLTPVVPPAALAHTGAATGGAREDPGDPHPHWRPAPETWPRVYLAWIAVCLPLAWGVGSTLVKSSVLFR